MHCVSGCHGGPERDLVCILSHRFFIKDNAVVVIVDDVVVVIYIIAANRERTRVAVIASACAGGCSDMIINIINTIIIATVLV